MNEDVFISALHKNNKQPETETDESHFYILIPSEVLRMSELSDGAKLLYGEILFLSQKNQFSFASNDYFMKLNCVSKRTVNSKMQELKKLGLIRTEVIRDKLTKQVEKRKIYVMKDFSNGDRHDAIDENPKITTHVAKKEAVPIVSAQKSKTEKRTYGSKQNVLLTNQEKDEYLKTLTAEQLNQAVEMYGDWKTSSGANPRSDFISMKWAVEKVLNSVLKTGSGITSVRIAECDKVTEEELENLPF